MTTTATLAVIILLLSLPALCAEDENKNWSDTAEVSLVATNGNSESSSLGFRNVLTREWSKAALTVLASGIRVESQEGARTAMELPGGGFKVIDPETKVTSENYTLKSRYRRDVSDRFFWYGGAGWDRNEPSGIENRYVVEGGVGNTWRDTEQMRFKTSYGATFTKQDDVDEDPSVDDTFFGARFVWDYMNKLTQTTTYTNLLIVDENLDETSDWRADMLNGLAVAINSHLALKAGLQLLYDNEPALEELKLFDLGGVDTGTTVTSQLDELDTILTVSLVVDF
jgi:putative salt-induced outer membrane protein YdiY